MEEKCAWHRALGLALAVLLVGPAQAQAPAPAQAAAQDAVPVRIARARAQDLPIVIRGIGTVQANQTVAMRARVEGTLDRVDFTEGQKVRQGDLLAEIDPRPYQAVLDQTLAKRAADMAQVANARLDLTRTATLARAAYASRQQQDTQAATVAQLQAAIAGDTAAIASAALNVSYCRIVAPIDAVAGLSQIDAGNLIRAGDTQPIVTLNQIDPIAVVFTLPEDALPRVHAALAAGHPPVAAFSSDDATPLGQGTLLTTSNAIDPATGTIALKAIFPNPHGTLWPGQFVSAHLQLAIEHGAITVPTGAIQHGPDNLYVFVVRPDRTVARQVVTIGYQDATLTEIRRGLAAGTDVVTAGQSRLQDGVRVAG